MLRRGNQTQAGCQIKIYKPYKRVAASIVRHFQFYKITSPTEIKAFMNEKQAIFCGTSICTQFSGNHWLETEHAAQTLEQNHMIRRNESEKELLGANSQIQNQHRGFRGCLKVLRKTHGQITKPDPMQFWFSMPPQMLTWTAIDLGYTPKTP